MSGILPDFEEPGRSPSQLVPPFLACVHLCLDFRGKRCFSVTCPALTFGAGGGHGERQGEALG